MCDISFHVGIVCSLSVSHGVVRTVFQSTLQPPFSNLTSFPASHGDLSFASIRVLPFDLDGSLRKWGRHLLGWPSGSRNAAVYFELGWPDALHLCTERLLCLFGACSCLVVNAALCRHSFSKLPCPSRVHGRLTAADCATLCVFPSKCVRHWASLFLF